MRYFYERTGGDGSRFCAVTDPGSPLIDQAHERGFRRVFENDPDIGGRYSVLSYFGLVPAVLAGVNIEGMLRQAQVAEQNCPAVRLPGAELGALARMRDGRARAARPRQAHLSRSPSRSRASACGSSSWSPSRPARRARASCPVADEPLGDAGRLRRRPRVRVPAQRGRAGRGAWTRRSRRSAGPATRPPPCRSAAARRTSAGSSSSPSSPPRWPAGRSGSTRSTSRTCRRRRTTPRGSSKEGLPDEDPGSLEDLLAKAEPPKYIAILGFVTPSEEYDAAAAGAAHQAARAHEVHDDVRLRAALPPLDRAVPQGRPRERPVHPALPARRRRTWRSPMPATRSST